MIGSLLWTGAYVTFLSVPGWAGDPLRRPIAPLCPFSIAKKVSERLTEDLGPIGADRALRKAAYAQEDLDYHQSRGPLPSDPPQVRRMKRARVEEDKRVPLAEIGVIDTRIRAELDAGNLPNAIRSASESLQGALRQNQGITPALRDAEVVIRAIDGSPLSAYDSLDDAALRRISRTRVKQLERLLEDRALPRIRPLVLATRSRPISAVLHNQAALQALGLQDPECLVLHVAGEPKPRVGRIVDVRGDHLWLEPKDGGARERIKFNAVKEAYSGDAPSNEEFIKNSIHGMWYTGRAQKGGPFRVVASTTLDGEPAAIIERAGHPFSFETVLADPLLELDWFTMGVTSDQGDWRWGPRIELHEAIQRLPQRLGRTMRSTDQRRIEGALEPLFGVRELKAREIAIAKFRALRPLYPDNSDGEAQFWEDYSRGLFGLSMEGRNFSERLSDPTFRREVSSQRPLQ